LAVVVAALLRYPVLDSIPPGLSFDEAGNGVAALDVARGDYRLWWPIGGGKEPLIAYLVQPIFWLLGPTRLALRLYAATMGIITVAGTYWLAWEMFVPPSASEGSSEMSSSASTFSLKWTYRLIPLFAALGLATAFWHVAISRIAFRALAMPAVEVLALAWLWRALRSSETVEGRFGRWYHFAGAGVLIGLGAYTYLPGRFVSVALVLFFVAEAVLARWRGERPLVVHHIWGLALSAVVALLVLLPLIVFFVQNPGALVERAGTVSIFNPAWNQGDLWGTLLRVTITTLGTFAGLTGDPNPMGNLPGRPMLGPVLAIFFWVGVAVSIWHIVRFVSGRHQTTNVPSAASASVPSVSGPQSPAPYLCLLCWWLVMLLPGILAPEAAPHHLRIIGTAPATYILAAVGLAQIVNLLCASRWISKWNKGPVFVGLLALLVFLAVGFMTVRDYFVRWARLPELYMAYDVYAVELAEQMAMETDPSVVYAIPMDLRAEHEARHYTLDFLYQSKAPYHYVPVDENTAATQLGEVASGREALRIVRWLQDKHAAADEREVVTFLLAEMGRLADEKTYPAYRVETWALPSANTKFALPAIQSEVGGTFDDMLRLEAVDLSVNEETVAVALRWAPLATMDVDYKASLRLVGADGDVVAQKDRYLRHNWHQGTSLWPPETVNEYYLLSSVAPGDYELRVVVYHPETLSPLIVDGGAEMSVGTVRVE
jgi:hypothetical protein